MKRRVICIAATVLCVAMTSMAYAKEIETTTEDDETYYTLEVKQKPYDIEKIASIVLEKYYKKYKKLVWIALAVAVIILGFLITAVLQGYQLQRIDSWLKPLKIENIYDSSWQLVNSLIAFTDGGIFGLGLGNSIQKYDYIPEAHNDFIGAIIYEELGIFGLALMIIPTAIIIFRLLKYADQIQNNKSRVILIGIASYFMLHLFVNLGGVSGLIPMTGVPLLLVSSGGSSTIAALIAIGIAQAIISKFNKEQLEKTDTQL